jgi:hypothetical protein
MLVSGFPCCYIHSQLAVGKGCPLHLEGNGIMSDSDQRHCPNCTSDKIVRSRRRGFFERSILSFTRWRPFRCAACKHRYYQRIDPANQSEALEPVEEKEAQSFSH